MKTLELNRIAIWRAKPLDTFTVRESGAGRAFAENKILSKTTAVTYRYAKNYEKNKVRFCLFAVSYSDDAKKAEKRLDEVAKSIKKPTPNADFEWTNYYLEDK